MTCMMGRSGDETLIQLKTGPVLPGFRTRQFFGRAIGVHLPFVIS